jgi:spore coat protein U-like protein
MGRTRQSYWSAVMTTTVRVFGRLALAASLAAMPSMRMAHAAVYSNGTTTGALSVSLTVQANCTIAANPLAFGTTGVLTSAINQQTTLSVTCSNSTPYNLGLDGGSVLGSTVSNRWLAGSQPLNLAVVYYQLYQDAGYTTIWGNTQGTNTLGGTGNGSTQTFNIYGQVPAQTTPQNDTYQSTITASVFF